MSQTASVEDKRRRIREGAIRAFSRDGFYATKTAQVAAEAGVANGTLYNYYGSKEAILVDVFETESARIQAAVVRILAADRPMREKLQDLFQTRIDQARENRYLARLFVGEELPLGGEMEQTFKRIFDESAQTLAGALRDAMGNGEIRTGDPIILAYTLLGTMRALLIRILLFDDDEAERLASTTAAALADELWHGLKPHEEAS